LRNARVSTTAPYPQIMKDPIQLHLKIAIARPGWLLGPCST
jgi:hypothetical protein